MFKYTYPSRRRFLQSSAALTAAFALPEWFLKREAEAEEVQKAQTQPAPKAKLPIALIGCGGRGTQVAGTEGKDVFEVVAICDADQKHLETAQKGKFPNATPYTDFRKVLERKDIKAIVNGTPDHWHTLINIHALRQGKDVYSEKPLTLTIEEGQKLIEVVKQTGGVLQTGSQQRSDKNFRLACELVRNGRIGKLVHVTTVLPTGGRGGPFPSKPVPEGFDWELWQGQTGRYDYVPERTHGLFRWWWDYSEGTLTDWGAHHFDIALWGIGDEHSGPVSIDGRGIGDPVKGGFTTYPSFHVEFAYGNGVTHTAVAVPQNGPPYATESILTPEEKEKYAEAKAKQGKVNDRGWRNAVRFEGTDGWIEVARGRIDASRPELLLEPLNEPAVKLYVSNHHQKNFVECVETRKPPICSVEIGHRSASVCHLAAISCRLDRKLFWDPIKEEILNDEQANSMRSRQMHEPWGYDKV